MLREISQIVWFHLDEVSRVVKLIEAESGMPGVGGGENAELLFNGYRLLFSKMKRVLDMDGCDGCTTIWTYLIHWTMYLTNG